MKAIVVWPQSKRFDITDPRIIASGSKQRSDECDRISIVGDGGMPPIPSHLVNEAGAKLIGDRIESLKVHNASDGYQWPVNPINQDSASRGVRSFLDRH